MNDSALKEIAPFFLSSKEFGRLSLQNQNLQAKKKSIVIEIVRCSQDDEEEG